MKQQSRSSSLALRGFSFYSVPGFSVEMVSFCPFLKSEAVNWELSCLSLYYRSNHCNNSKYFSKIFSLPIACHPSGEKWMETMEKIQAFKALIYVHTFKWHLECWKVTTNFMYLNFQRLTWFQNKSTKHVKNKVIERQSQVVSQVLLENISCFYHLTNTLKFLWQKMLYFMENRSKYQP